MRFTIAALLLLCAGCAEGPDAGAQALISEVEKRVSLPKGAGPLRCYKRYYTVLRGKALQDLLGHPDKLPAQELLIGTYREPGPGESPGIEWVKSTSDVPEIHDGGCSNLTVWYAVGWLDKGVEASCSPNFAGQIPEQIDGKPLRC